jgi:Flp pilus assembly pilin Flp
MLCVANEKGQGLVEYALILLLLALAVIVVLGTFGLEVNNWYQAVIDGFPDV